MTRNEINAIKKELAAQGYRPFSYGDFWNTGYTAGAMRRGKTGEHKSSAKDDPLIYDTKPGPKGGCWIRWLRKSKRG